ncbi:MAG: hypothetical protein SV253_08355 [Halobacteria archaeon]|nr:hypothetical protein [Halobacteria archaeon]
MSDVEIPSTSKADGNNHPVLVVLPCLTGKLNLPNKPFGKESLERAVDAPQRISLSDLESGQTLKETSLEAPCANL